jgi:hypothetical protein
MSTTNPVPLATAAPTDPPHDVLNLIGRLTLLIAFGLGALLACPLGMGAGWWMGRVPAAKDGATTPGKLQGRYVRISEPDPGTIDPNTAMEFKANGVVVFNDNPDMTSTYRAENNVVLIRNGVNDMIGERAGNQLTFGTKVFAKK